MRDASSGERAKAKYDQEITRIAAMAREELERMALHLLMEMYYERGDQNEIDVANYHFEHVRRLQASGSL
jgi:hypothetical protein